MPSVLDDLVIKPGGPLNPEQTQIAPQTPPEQKNEPEAKSEPGKGVSVEEPGKKEPKEEKKTRSDYQKLEDARDAAEKLAKEREKEAADAKSRIAELEKQYSEFEPTKKDAESLRKEAEELKAENARVRAELKSASIERDPDFRAKYTQGKQVHVDHLKDLVPREHEADFLRALRTGNEDTLNEIRENLQPHLQRKWDAHLARIEQLEVERQEELANADRTWEKQQEQKQFQMARSSAESLYINRQLGKEVLGKLVEEVKGLDENPQLLSELKDIGEGLAGGKGAEAWDAKAMIQSAMMTRVLSRIVEGMAGDIKERAEKFETLETQLKERDEKIANYEAFVRKHHGELPGAETFSATEKKADALGFKNGMPDIVVRVR